MKVSVIIPVFNAEKFIEETVRSVLNQEGLGEILLIEDRSSDNSLEICLRLAKAHANIRVLRHPNYQNRGVSASRNLGIQAAQCEYIAFLDADDYFLPGRFLVAREIFQSDPSVDGVYEAVGIHFEDNDSRSRWLRRNSNTELTTMWEAVDPKDLFESQSPVGNKGYCPTGGWVVKRTVFKKTGLFNVNMRYHEDTAMYVRFSAVGKMLPGRLNTPVAMRRVHSRNSTASALYTIQANENRIAMWAALYRWAKGRLSHDRQNRLAHEFVNAVVDSCPRKNASPAQGKLILTGHLLIIGLRFPDVFAGPHVREALWHRFNKPNRNLQKIGTAYGGWVIPVDLFYRGGICYCAGAGEDISFDVALAERFNCGVYIFDPTPRAIQHFETFKEQTLQGKPMPINNNPNEIYMLSPRRLKNFRFLDRGLWDKDTVLRFYSPADVRHVSCSALKVENEQAYFDAKVNRLSNLMQELGHKRLDLLKLDIEGAEYKVIDSIIEDQININVLCVEFHETAGVEDQVASYVRKLEDSGYKVAFADDFLNYTFIKSK